MLFSSFSYMLVFFPLVVAGTIALRRIGGARAAQAFVLFASLVFYAWFKPASLPYLLGSVLVNWLLARQIGRTEDKPRKRWLQLGLVLNIGYLCLFKYINFFLSIIRFALPRNFHFIDLDFPLGISFFTVMQIMYLVDVYEQLLDPLGLFDLASFVTFFPYLIAGPIAKAKRIAHQFGDFGGKDGQVGALFSRGLLLFAIGLAKKTLLATTFAGIADVGFNSTQSMSAAEAWCFSLAYMLQMYFDFSGYSDMAIGSALMLGIEIPRNFDAPLRSKSLIEFWQRWHISLSQFITTYIYTPILKSMWKISLFTSALATLIAMTIAGLWHGPAWTFVAYGTVHGLGLGINQYWRKKKMPKLPGFVSWFVTFIIIDIGLLLFRASSMHFAGHMLAAMVNPHHAFALGSIAEILRGTTAFSKFVLIPAGIVAAFFWKSSDEIQRDFKPGLPQALAVYTLVTASCLFLVFHVSQDFLYFKF